MSKTVFTFTFIISISPQNKPKHNEISPKGWFEPWNHLFQKGTTYEVIRAKIY